MPVGRVRVLHDLTESTSPLDPLEQFASWWEDALRSGLPQPEAMALATASPSGRPSSRMVLLKGFDRQGFVFYTNRQSRKGREIAVNPWAALTVYWTQLHRQIRIEGRVEQIDADESDLYFETRPRGSKIAAWASQQSQVIGSRRDLEQRVADLEAAYPESVPRPSFWGGYRVRPTSIEFWQGRTDRLHDRLLYTRLSDTTWRRERLSP